MKSNNLSADSAAKIIGKKSRQSFYKYFKTERFSAEMVVLLKKIGFDVNYIIYKQYSESNIKSLENEKNSQNIDHNSENKNIPSTNTLIAEMHQMITYLKEKAELETSIFGMTSKKPYQEPKK